MGRFLSKICNLRVLIVLMAVWLILGGALPKGLNHSLEYVNQSFFRLGLYFTSLPAPRTSVTVIHVPDLEYERWLVDLPGAKRLLQLLELLEKGRLEAGTGAVLGLILERPIAVIQPESESLLSEIQQGRISTQHLYQETSDALARRETIVEKLSSKEVVLGVNNRQSSQHRILSTHPGQLQKIPRFLSGWLWPAPEHAVISVPTPILDYFPIIMASNFSPQEYLAIKQENGYSPSFWVQFLLRAKSTKISKLTSEYAGENVEWNRDQGFSFDGKLVKASPSGAVVPVYGQLSGIQRSLRQMSLGAALVRDDLSGWILIGRDGSSGLYEAAQTLASLGDEALMLTPLWWSPLQKLVLVILALFILLVVPHLSHKRLVYSLFFIVASLVTVQIGAQALEGWWLPSGELLLFVVTGYVILILWLLNNQYQRRIVNRADEASIDFSSLLLNQGSANEQDLNKAFELLKNCVTSEASLQGLYDLERKFEEIADFTKAFEVLKQIRKRKRKYRDVNEKLKTLKVKLIQSGAGTSAESHESTEASELISVQAQNLPNTVLPKASFGRYEIEGELGRGASGIVYLGFDPLISRQVAIKTLNYLQFSESEIEVVKARFEREAEAAGGLSHPNIVSVFDVGEEGGAAYIAMDFAKGAPLSDFVTAEKLLPAYEVYRIVLAVAEALEYAHNHKIVHRDIKPGNVLYCDDPFQVKITDFGIARFVDHSHTQTGEILGSPLYMAPEQLLGRKVSFSADIFSLGVMFYQLLTGVLPFNGDSLASLTYDIVHNKHKGARTLRRSLPASATRITNVALQKKSTDRYTSAEAMADALRKAIKRDFSAESKRE